MSDSEDTVPTNIGAVKPGQFFWLVRNRYQLKKQLGRSEHNPKTAHFVEALDARGLWGTLNLTTDTTVYVEASSIIEEPPLEPSPVRKSRLVVIKPA